MATTKSFPSAPQNRSTTLPEMNWSQIDEPGCYLIVDTGELVRVPAEALAPGHSPFMSLTSSKGTRVARLSGNPAEPISVLRAIAADNDYFVHF